MKSPCQHLGENKKQLKNPQDLIDFMSPTWETYGMGYLNATTPNRKECQVGASDGNNSGSWAVSHSSSAVCVLVNKVGFQCIKSWF